MKPSEVKVGDWAVNNALDAKYLIIDKRYQIVAKTEKECAIVDEDGDVYSINLNTCDWSFEPNPSRLNAQTIIVEVPTKVVVTFEKTEIEHGEEYLIKTFELADLPELKKNIQHEVENLANPLSDIVNVKWEK